MRTGSSFLKILPVLVGALVLVGERARPLRPRYGRSRRRLQASLVVAALASPVTILIERPLLRSLGARAQSRRRGLLHRLGLAPALQDAATIVALDYGMFLWHILLHRAPLWRFHEVHHLDQDLDASTALRFHVGEMLASIPYRAVQVAVLGSSPRAIDAWYRLFASSVLFHHANLRLPEGFERLLAWFIVTPRMHGIHHSHQVAEQHSNWSSGMTIWDRLHRSFRLDVPQDRIRMGPPGLALPPDLPAGQLLRWPLSGAPDRRLRFRAHARRGVRRARRTTPVRRSHLSAHRAG